MFSKGTEISLDCAFDYEKDRLCDPRHLLNTVSTSILLHVADNRCLIEVQINKINVLQFTGGSLCNPSDRHCKESRKNVQGESKPTGVYRGS